MRPAVADSILEEYNPSDRLSRLDWNACRCWGALVRELVTAVAGPSGSLRRAVYSGAPMPTRRGRQRAPPGIDFHFDRLNRLHFMLSHMSPPIAHPLVVMSLSATWTVIV